MKGTARVAMVAFWLGACGCGARTGLVAFDGAMDAAPRESGTAVDAEARADAGVPDTRVGLPGDPSGAVRACVLAVSCFPKGVTWFPRTPSACLAAFARRGWATAGWMEADPLLTDRLVSCAARATDCATFSACFGGDLPSLGRTVEGGQCKGSLLVTGAGTLDCAKFGSECIPLATGAIRAACTKTSCEAMHFAKCDGRRGQVCTAGALYEFDCGQSGLVCTSTLPGELCQGSGPACRGPEDLVCLGRQATYCPGGRRATYDCGANPFASACDPTARGTLPCRAAGNECSASFAGECAKDGLVVCVDGRKRTVDCRTAGFETCHGPRSDGTPARCGHYL